MKKNITDREHLKVLNQLTLLYEDMVQHEGFSNINIEFKKCPGNTKEITIFAGCAHKFNVPKYETLNQSKRFVVVDSYINSKTYSGPDRRKQNRRNQRRRTSKTVSRNFRLERRAIADRRRISERRK